MIDLVDAYAGSRKSQVLASEHPPRSVASNVTSLWHGLSSSLLSGDHAPAGQRPSRNGCLHRRHPGQSNVWKARVFAAGLEKCVEYVSHIMTGQGITKGTKVNDVMQMPAPGNVSGLPIFLGSFQF